MNVWRILVLGSQRRYNTLLVLITTIWPPFHWICSTAKMSCPRLMRKIREVTVLGENVLCNTICLTVSNEFEQVTFFNIKTHNQAVSYCGRADIILI